MSDEAVHDSPAIDTGYLSLPADVQAALEEAVSPAHLFRKKTRPVQACQWLPGDLAEAGRVIGWLMAHGADFFHPDGLGETTTLAVGTAGGTMVAKPGWWITLGEGAWWVYPPDIFEGAFEPDRAPGAELESARLKLAAVRKLAGDLGDRSGEPDLGRTGKPVQMPSSDRRLVEPLRRMLLEILDGAL